MKKIILSIIFSFFITYPFIAIGEEEDDLGYKTVIKKVDGIKFEVVEDRPIEKKNGVIAPMAMDKYVAMKCFKLNKSIEEIKMSLDAIKLRLDSDMGSRLSDLEKRLKKIEDFIKDFKNSLNTIE